MPRSSQPAWSLQKLAAKGKITAEAAAQASERLRVAGALSQLADAALVVEVIVEALEPKRALLAALEDIVAHHRAQGVTVSTRSEALREIHRSIDLAILDVDVTNGQTFDIADELRKRHVPFVFVSGSDPMAVPEHLQHVPFVPKPFSESEIRHHVEAIVKARRGTAIG